jgi:hypothetical protein
MSVYSLFSRARVLAETFLDERAAAMTLMWRVELRRVAVVVACSLVLSFFVCAAAGFAILAILLAFWDTHRVLASAGISVGCIVCAAGSLLLLRNQTRVKSPTA